MASPQPWHYSVRWALYHFRPSSQQHTELHQRPLTYRFVPVTSEPRARVVLVGDLCLAADRVPTASAAIARVFANADLIVGNYQHQPGGDPGALAATLANLEIAPDRCVLSLANRHAGAGGAEGLSQTAEHLRALGITPVGVIRGGDSPVTVIETHDLRFGIAAWTHWLDQDVFDEGEGVATPEQVLHRNWQQLKTEHAIDCLIGSPHWEWQGEHIPRQDTVAIAQHLSESGFDMLGGHHTGVVQPMEWFHGNGRRPGICQFSLGNLGAAPPTAPNVAGDDWERRLGVILEVEVITSGRQRGQVAGYRLHAIAQIDTSTGPRLIPVRYAPVEVRQRMWERIALLFDEARYPNKAEPLQPASSL